MYCSSCGTKLPDGENHCPKCGNPADAVLYRGAVPPVTRGIADPDILFQSTESKIFGIISSFIFGLGMTAVGFTDSLH